MVYNVNKEDNLKIKAKHSLSKCVEPTFSFLFDSQ